MSNYFKGMVRISQEDYTTLSTDGSLTKNGETYTYSPSDTLYVTPDEDVFGTKVYLHRITLNASGSSSNPIIIAYIDYYSTKSTAYSDLSFLSNTSASSPLPCGGYGSSSTLGTEAGYYIYLTGNDIILNGSYDVNTSSGSYSVSDNIVGYLFK